MKRSLQEVIELVVFGLIALLLGTGLLWLAGAAFGLVGTVLGWLAGLVWALLRFLVPVALVAALAVFLVRAAQGRSPAAPSSTPVPTVDAAPASPTVVAAAAPADASEGADRVPPADAAPTGDAAADATRAGSGDGATDADDGVARPRDGA